MMGLVALVGIGVNTVSALLVMPARKGDLNAKGSFVHMAGIGSPSSPCTSNTARATGRPDHAMSAVAPYGVATGCRSRSPGI
jgi:hypothetical protein